MTDQTRQDFRALLEQQRENTTALAGALARGIRTLRNEGAEAPVLVELYRLRDKLADWTTETARIEREVDEIADTVRPPPGEGE